MDLCETSTDYEQLARKIYAAIMDAEGVQNIEVEHDVNIEGKSGVKHQIDVFWEYRYAGIAHKVLIECKYYSHPVSLIHARNMLGLISDIPNSQGLIVTTQGYQSGVIEFCKHYQINLKLIRPPQDSDWDGYVRSIDLHGELYQSHYLDILIAFDGKHQETKDVFDSCGNKVNIDTRAHKIQEDGTTSAINVWLDKKIVPDISQINVEKKEEIFPDSAFIEIEGKKLKVKSVSVRWSLSKQEVAFSLDAMNFVHAVLEDFNSGEIEYTLQKEHNKQVNYAHDQRAPDPPDAGLVT